MNPFARTVIAYHGCRESFATKVLSKDFSVEDWDLSHNDYDWLGKGIYFWEYAPSRALRWAREKADDWGEEPAVVGAVIQLGECLDLTDIRNTKVLAEAHKSLVEIYDSQDKTLPVNTGPEPYKKGRFLDNLVVNYTQVIQPYQTVRCAFPEGAPAYDGAMIRTETHVQLAVVDRTCVIGVFRPTYGL